MKRARKEAMAETREALIAAAIECFGSDGLDASLDKICARAGFTRGAFYVHFRDRDELLVAAMDRVGARFLDALFAGGGLAATVGRFVQAVLSGEYPLTPRGGVRPHQLLEACARSLTVRRRYTALIATSIEQLAAMVAEGQRAELRADVVPYEVATLLLATVIGAQTMMELEVPLDPPALARALLHLLAPPARSKRTAPPRGRGRR